MSKWSSETSRTMQQNQETDCLCPFPHSSFPLSISQCSRKTLLHKTNSKVFDEISKDEQDWKMVIILFSPFSSSYKKEICGQETSIFSSLANKCPNEISVLLWRSGNYSCFLSLKKMKKYAGAFIKSKLTVHNH